MASYGSFPTYRRLLRPKTFEINGAKGENSHDEQFRTLPQLFHLYSMIKFSFIEGYDILAWCFLMRLLKICHIW